MTRCYASQITHQAYTLNLCCINSWNMCMQVKKGELKYLYTDI